MKMNPMTETASADERQRRNEYHKQWRKNNKERIRRWRQDNKAKLDAYRKKWRHDHFEQYLSQMDKDNAKISKRRSHRAILSRLRFRQSLGNSAIRRKLSEGRKPEDIAIEYNIPISTIMHAANQPTNSPKQ